MPSVGYATLQVIPSVRGIGDEIRRQLVAPASDAGEQAGQAAGSGMRDKLLAGAALAAAATGAILVAGITKAIEKANISSTLQAQLGTSSTVAAKQGKIAGKLYSSGVSGSFQEAADAIKAVVQSGLAPPDATNAQLERIATKATDVANVFGQDLGGVTNAVSQLMRTGLAKNSSQAFDLITKGFQSGADKAGDLLDTINEYGTQFRKAGLDGATSIGLMNQAIRAGARDSDVAADAIKEFSIRAVDGSKTTKSGFKLLGLSATDMADKFAKGGKSASGALDTTLDKLRGIKDPVKQSAAATALFGTQAEDLGDALFAMDPSSAAKDLGKFGGAAKKVGDTIRSGPAHELEVFKRQLETGFVDLVGGTLLPALGRADDVIKGVGSAVSSVLGWFREWGIVLAPLAILIGGVTLALNAQAIATGIVTAVFAAYRAAILVGTAVTSGFAAAQALLNAVMALNPFVLIAIAVVALGAALVVAWKKSDTFRKIVTASWEAIKTAALFVWNNVLKPALTWIWGGMKRVGAVAMWLWRNAIQPAFRGIWTAAKILLTIITVIVIIPIIAAFKLLAAIGKWLWKNALAPAFRGIASVAKWLWNNVLKPTWNAIKAGIRAMGAVFRWLYENVIKPVWNGIKKAISFYWQLIKAVFNTVIGFLRNTLGKAFRWLLNNVIRPVWDGIKKAISVVWNKGIKPVFEAAKRGVDRVGDAFRKAKDFIGDQWAKLKGIAKKPIEFIINTVYNKGIVPMWNKVAKAFGAPTLGKFKGFATGGVMPGYTPGRDNSLIAVGGGEAIMRPEWTRAVGPGYVNSMNAAARSGGVGGVQKALGIPGFADGGIFSWIGRGLQGVGSGAWDFVKKGASWLKDTIAGSARAGVTNIVEPLLGQIPGVDNGFGRLVQRLPRSIIDAIFGYSEKADKRMVQAGVGGAGTRAALRFARSQAGKPYQWGGVGNPSWDCSGFMGGIQSVITGQNPRRRLWSTFAFNGAQAPAGWRRGLKAPFMIGITNAGVGHTAGTLNGVNVESRGGDGVLAGPRARGYNGSLFNSWYGYAPSRKYDDGGWLMPGATMAVNQTGRPEAVLTDPEWRIAEEAIARQAQAPSVHYEINARTADFTVRDLQRVQRVQEARARVGRPR